MQYTLFLLAVVLALLSTLSLLAKNEGLRGMGRVIGGLSQVSLAAFLLTLTYGSSPALPGSYGLPSALLLVAGLVTLGSGARKFARRKAAQ